MLGKIKAFLAVLILAVSALWLMTACKPDGGQQTATPEPTGATTDVKIVMKPGDTYRIFLCTNIEENQYVDGVSAGTRSEEIRSRWLSFQEQYGVTVTWIATPGGDWLGSVLTAAASNQPICDIYQMGGPFTIPMSLTFGNVQPGTYYENLLQYSEYTSFDDERYWDKKAQDAVGIYNGEQYIAVPRGEGWTDAALSQVCFFNKTLLASGGHSGQEIYDLYGSGEWTFDKMRQIAADCTDADRGIYGLCVSENGMSVLSLITANGGSVLTSDAQGVQSFSADSEKALKAVNFFLDMCNDGCVLTENTVRQDEASLFKKGSVTMMLTYANRVILGEGPRKGAIYQRDDLSYGIVLPPKGPDAQDYMTDRNWYAPISVFKGHDNPAGVVQCMDLYMRPSVAYGSTDSELLLESEAASYFQDEQSIQTLFDAVDKSVVTSYMAYWNVESSGVSLCGLTTYGIEKWLSGESTPERDYAAGRDAVNRVLAGALGK
ncbi:MAG: extracellular solute-binding protein [Firmicutes bacterium]|nr:extracellular solute-binding protein [Bacillota bacterium]